METISIQIKELENCVNLCLENAKQYIMDAEMLIKNASFGHAYALAILAYEELGKAIMCIFGTFGCLFTNKDMLTPSIKGWNKTFKNHVTKQWIQRIIDELYRTVYQVVGQQFDMKESEIEELEMIGLDDEDMKELIKNFVQSPDKGIELIKSIFSSMGNFKKDLEDLLKERGVDRVIKEFPLKKPLEKEKQRGLYVDYKDGKFISPKSIGKDEAIRNLTDVKRSFGRMKELIQMDIMILELGHYNAIKKFAEVFAQDT
ncbi:MAG: AbiV family abortive infection protein [Thermoplasmatales archaeon]|nr:AbiV family abortive infection protein [Thermoplasmatales archaeon]